MEYAMSSPANMPAPSPVVAIPRPPSAPNPSNISASPASLSRPPLTPSSQTPNPFEFSVPSIPPRLSRVGRRISEMGMNVLVGSDFPDEPPAPRREMPRAGEVPGMGDEPIMCPFCEKPLPPAFILTQMAHNHASSQERKRVQGGVQRQTSLSVRRPSEMSRSPSASASASMSMSRVSESAGPASVGMSSAASAPGLRRAVSGESAPQIRSLGMTAVKTPDITPTDALLESTRPKPGEVLPKATAESLLPTVKSAEAADTAGATSIISPDEVRKWSSLAGINLSSGRSTPVPIEKPNPIEKPIPALAPPPPPSSTIADRLKKTERPTSASGSSGFGSIFRRGSPKPKASNSDDEDDFGGNGGYAKLSGPPSPDKAEAPSWREKARATSIKADQSMERTRSGSRSRPGSRNNSRGPAGTDRDKAASDELLRQLLEEVLGKVNNMSKSHEDLLHSHTTLLTSLKIARSNLAMAEANSEMLEEQLKRVPPPPVARPPVRTQASTRPSSPSNVSGAPLPSRSTSSVPTINVSARKSLDEARPLPSITAPRRSEDSRPARPTSMIMPSPGSYNSGPMTGPASSTSQRESKGIFGFLGGKTNVPGLGTIVLPTAKEMQASAARFGDSIAGNSRPGTPGREGGQFFDYHAPSQYAPVANERPQRSNTGDGIIPSPSSTLRPSPVSNTGTSPPTVRPQPISPALAAELVKLRQAQTSSQARMDAMNKELTELKTGKLEMEAELESLSQALFEEANKMVSEERKKRAEAEDSLKEVKEEREALKETIKVLGGQGEVIPVKEGTPVVRKEAKDFRPRDLDKHYEALRKTIHHVSDGTSPTIAFSEAVSGNTGSEEVDIRREVGQSLRTEANPWADVNFGLGARVVSPSRREPDLDPLDSMTADQTSVNAGVAAEMERGG